jgi:hypothetical protein
LQSGYGQNKNKKRTDLDVVMNNSQPLLLVFDDVSENVVRRLTDLLSYDPIIHPCQDGAYSDQNRRIIFKGITFVIRITDQSEGLHEYQHIFCESICRKQSSRLSIGLDRHLAGGEHVAPIAVVLLEIGAYLATNLGAIVVGWTPARIVSDSDYFTKAANDYVAGGVFPSLALVNFTFSEDEKTVRTFGLNWFSGQELELHGNDLPKPEIMRRAVRIVHDMAVNGPIMVDETISDLDPQHLLRLCPQADAALAIGTITSILDTAAV